MAPVQRHQWNTCTDEVVKTNRVKSGLVACVDKLGFHSQRNDKINLKLSSSVVAEWVGWIRDLKDSGPKTSWGLWEGPRCCKWRLFSFSLCLPYFPPQQTPLFLPQEGLNLSITYISPTLQNPVMSKWLFIFLLPQELPSRSHYPALLPPLPAFWVGPPCTSLGMLGRGCWKQGTGKGAGHQDNLCCLQGPLPCAIPPAASTAAAEVF